MNTRPWGSNWVNEKWGSLASFVAICCSQNIHQIESRVLCQIESLNIVVKQNARQNVR